MVRSVAERDQLDNWAILLGSFAAVARVCSSQVHDRDNDVTEALHALGWMADRIASDVSKAAAS